MYSLTGLVFSALLISVAPGDFTGVAPSEGAFEDAGREGLATALADEAVTQAGTSQAADEIALSPAFRLDLEQTRGEIPNALYYPGLSASQEKAQVHVLSELNSFLTRHNIQYIAHGGQVLGSLRHHGFVPWDSDVDLKISDEEWPKYQSALEVERPLLEARGLLVVKNSVWTIRSSAPPSTTDQPPVVGPAWTSLGNPVPMVELWAANLSKYCGGNGIAPPREVLYGQGGVPFWTCHGEIQKWTETLAKGGPRGNGDNCDASWNHPTLNGDLRGNHLFDFARSEDPTDAEIEARWKGLLERNNKANPNKFGELNGMFEWCHNLHPFYNFVPSSFYDDRNPPNASLEASLTTLMKEPRLSSAVGSAVKTASWTCSPADDTSRALLPPPATVLYRGGAAIQTRLRLPAVPWHNGTEQELCEVSVTLRNTSAAEPYFQLLGMRCRRQVCFPRALRMFEPY
jgi:hypothetical protein